jgi:hypothetical protein
MGLGVEMTDKLNYYATKRRTDLNIDAEIWRRIKDGRYGRIIEDIWYAAPDQVEDQVKVQIQFMMYGSLNER